MSENDEHSLKKHLPGFMISAGTQVVLKSSKTILGASRFRKAGSVGIIAKCPERVDGDYLVEFADGETVLANHAELVLRRNEIDTELKGESTDYWEYVIFRCQVGSRAYGLSHEASDTDIRGVFLPPAHLHWSLYSVPEQLEILQDGHDEVIWELEKFLRLCLKANPNVLEVLWSPIVIQSSDLSEELRSIRKCFISKHIFKTYSGYVLSQFRRMKNRFEKTGEYKVKHAMHLVRLLLSGIQAIQTGEILIDVSEHRNLLLNIRDEQWSFEEVRKHALELDQQFQDAFARTHLPDQPDFAVVNDFLVRARRSALDS